MSTADTPSITVAPVGPTVHLLHQWDRNTDRLTLHRDYPAALAALARNVRADWAHRPSSAAPDTPDGLDDAAAVRAYYGTDVAGAPTAPTSIDLLDDGGFTISAEPVDGPEPEQVSLRLGTLSVRDLDENAPAAAPSALTYCLDAAGLTVEVTHSTDGYPAVLVAAQPHLAGLPLTVQLAHRAQPATADQPRAVR